VVPAGGAIHGTRSRREGNQHLAPNRGISKGDKAPLDSAGRHAFDFKVRTTEPKELAGIVSGRVDGGWFVV